MSNKQKQQNAQAMKLAAVRNKKKNFSNVTSKAMLGIRTQGTIITKLAKRAAQVTSMRKRRTPPYVLSHLNPFLFKGAPIPDGNNKNFICNDMVGYSTIRAGSAVTTSYDFDVQTFPFLPVVAGLISSSVMVSDGIQILPQTTNTAYATTTSNHYYPICTPTPFTTSGGSYPILGKLQEDPWTSAKCRVGTFGYRIMYTGPVNTCAGAITVTTNNVVVTPSAPVNVVTGVSNGTFVVLPNNTAGAVAENGTPQFNVEVNQANAAPYKTSRTFRPEETIYIIPSHSEVNDLRPIFPGAFPVLANNSSHTPLTTAYYNMFCTEGTAVSNRSGGIIWYDDGWESFSISFRGINPDASFRIEAIICAEFTPKNGSPFVDLTMKESPVDKTALSIVNKLSDPVQSLAEVTKTVEQTGRPDITGQQIITPQEENVQIAAGMEFIQKTLFPYLQAITPTNQDPLPLQIIDKELFDTNPLMHRKIYGRNNKIPIINPETTPLKRR